MALQVTRGPTVAPIRLMLYGQEGVGKTTWAAGCPSALFLTVEDGGGDIDYQRVVVPTWAGLREAVRDLTRDPMGYRTLVLDTIDSYERALHAHIVNEAGVSSIEQVEGGYGKGYTAAAEAMTALSHDLDELRRRQRVNVILLGHAVVKPFNDPMGNPYDRYELRMHKAASALWMGWADAVLFACFDVTVRTAKRNAAVTEKGKAVDSKRVIYTTKDAAYDAKNRYNLPAELPVEWGAFARAIRWDERDAALTNADHPSWSVDAAKFTAELGKLAMDPDTVAEVCRRANRARPSRMDLDTRRRLLSWLGTDAGRAAYAAVTDERDQAAVTPDAAPTGEQGAA